MLYIIVALALLVILVVVDYNRLVRSRQLLREAWSGIDVQLKRRHDLIPNLIQTVKGYSHHESTVLEDIAETRVRAEQPGTVEDKSEVESELGRQITSVFAVAEAYPDLKASTSFLDLQKSLSKVEDDIQYARRYYNGSVRDFNIMVQSFPSNAIARLFGFRNEPFFEVEYATERETPDVAFA